MLASGCLLFKSSEYGRNGGFRCVLCFMGCSPLPDLSAEVGWNGVRAEKTRREKPSSRGGSGVTWGVSGVEWGEMGGGGGERKGRLIGEPPKGAMEDSIALVLCGLRPSADWGWVWGWVTAGSPKRDARVTQASPKGHAWIE